MLSQSRGIHAGALLVLLLVVGGTLHMGHGAAEHEQRTSRDHVLQLRTWLPATAPS